MPNRLATALGCTDGQVWTLGISLAVAVSLLPATLPAGLHPLGDPTAAAQPFGLTAPVVPSAPASAGPSSHPVPSLTPAPVAVAPGVLPPIPLPPPGPEAPSAPPRGSGSPHASTSPPEAGALTLTEGGWYDPDADASARAQLTPAGELPVSANRGSRAASSLLRLHGNASELVLLVDTTPGRTAGTAALQLCRNATPDWTGRDNEPAAQAPPVTTDCATGTADAGRWHFALAGLGPVDAPTGFTLQAVLAGAPTETFAVTFFREIPA